MGKEEQQRVFEDPIIDSSKGISSYLYTERLQQDTGFNGVSELSFKCFIQNFVSVFIGEICL